MVNVEEYFIHHQMKGQHDSRRADSEATQLGSHLPLAERTNKNPLRLSFRYLFVDAQGMEGSQVFIGTDAPVCKQLP